MDTLAWLWSDVPFPCQQHTMWLMLRLSRQCAISCFLIELDINSICRYNGKNPNGHHVRQKSSYTLMKKRNFTGVKPYKQHLASSAAGQQVQLMLLLRAHTSKKYLWFVLSIYFWSHLWRWVLHEEWHQWWTRRFCWTNVRLRASQFSHGEWSSLSVDTSCTLP